MRARLLGLLLSACTLVGCNRQEAASTAGPKSPGRYAGIGTFEAGRLWREIKGASTTQDPATAKLADDEHVIVVLDSHTGEVRQCGDLSGFCVAMNPWGATSASAPTPVKLNKHAADIDTDSDGASVNKTSASDNALNEAESGH